MSLSYPISYAKATCHHHGRVGPRGTAYFCNSCPIVAECHSFDSFARDGRVASFSSTRHPVAQKVAHGELHALVAQDAVGGSQVIEEVGDRIRDQKLAAARAHRATRVLDHDCSLEASFEVAWRDLLEIRDRRIKALVQICKALCIVRGRYRWRTQQVRDRQLGSLRSPVDLSSERIRVHV